jgi:hypothetical protein
MVSVMLMPKGRNRKKGTAWDGGLSLGGGVEVERETGRMMREYRIFSATPSSDKPPQLGYFPWSLMITTVYVHAKRAGLIYMYVHLLYNWLIHGYPALRAKQFFIARFLGR